MITLDTNLTLYPGLYAYLPLIKSKNSKAYSAIDQYSDAQAAKGAPETQNTQSTQETDKASKTNNITNDYAALIEALKLNIPENKLAILKLIPHLELVKFLSLLNKDELLSGLKLFLKDKLLEFVYHIPKEDLLKMLFKMFISKDQILELMPIKELNHFLSSTKIEKSNLIKIFQSLSTTELAQIAESATGIPQGKKSQGELLQVVKGLDINQITDGIKGLEYKKMRGIISEMLKQDESLYTEFTHESLFKETLNFSKPSLIEGMGVIDSDQLIKFLDKLPDSFLALVVSQIDTELLSKILVNDYQKLLSSISI